MKIRITDATPKDFDPAYLHLLPLANHVLLALDGHMIAQGDIGEVRFTDGGIEFEIKPKEEGGNAK